MTEKLQYLSIKNIIDSEDYPFSEGAIRFFLQKRKVNGLKKCVRKIGKRLYIRKDLFNEWIESKEENQGETTNIEGNGENPTIGKIPHPIWINEKLPQNKEENHD